MAWSARYQPADTYGRKEAEHQLSMSRWFEQSRGGVCQAHQGTAAICMYKTQSYRQLNSPAISKPSSFLTLQCTHELLAATGTRDLPSLSPSP